MKTPANAIWLVAGRIAGDALSLALFVVVAREFGPAGIGIYSFTFAIASILFEIATLGLDEYGVREYVRRPAERRRDLVATLVGAQLAITVVAVGVLAVLLAAGAIDRSNALLLSLMVAYQIASAIANTFFIAPFASGQVGLQVAAEVAARVGILVVAVGLIASGSRSLVHVLVGFPVFGFALMVVAAFLARRLGSSVVPLISLSTVIGMLRTLWSFAATGLLFAVFSRAGVVLLFLLVGSVEAGLFASAYKFAEVGYVLLAMLPYAAYARMSELFGTAPERFGSFAREVLRATLLFAAVIAWGMYFILPLAVVPLLGSRFEGTQDILQSLALLLLLFGVNAYLSRALLVADLQVVRFRNTFILALLAGVLGVALIPGLGVRGAVVALTVALLGATVLDLVSLRRVAGFGETLRTLGVFATCIALAVAAGRSASAYGAAAWAAPAVSLAVLLLAAHVGRLASVRRWAAALR